MRAAFAGGVTGGHVAPGVALAEAICAREPGSAVLFLSVGNELEQRMVTMRGFALEQVAARSSGGARALPGAPGAWARARWRLGRFRPEVVIGLGGYASLGGAFAAVTMGVPLVLLEQNAAAGRANVLFARFAERVCCQWPGAAAQFGGRGEFTGSPVRAEIAGVRTADKAVARARFGLRADAPTLLVMGGSQGARAINAALEKAAPALAGRMQVIHLAGASDAAGLEAAYRAAGLTAHVTGFLDAMDAAYAASDAVLCRAGATSLAELCAAGLPAVVVPYPFAKDDHQRANAREAARQGWAEPVEQDALSGGRLVRILEKVFLDSARREAMAAAARASARLDAADVIIGVLRRAAERSGRRAAVKAAGVI